MLKHGSTPWLAVKILIIDDGSDLGSRLLGLVASARPGFRVTPKGFEGSLHAAETLSPDAIFVVLPSRHNDAARMAAWSLIHGMRSSRIQTPIGVFADQRDDRIAHDALRSGAQDVLYAAEADCDSVGHLLDMLVERTGLGRTIAAQPLHNRSLSLIGSSPAMREVREMVEAVAAAPQSVLIVGDTGTGKGLVARAIHDRGPRAASPFVAVNCAATPASLLESIMFGHERGAFTGAFRRQRGQFELVGTGTIVLDEVADVPVEVQAKLLRAVEDRRFHPIGAEREVPFSGRILSTTNADLADRMTMGRFRRDLYYRLGVIIIRLPSLAERRGDIPELLEAFLASAPRRLEVAPEAMNWLAAKSWPGNVRELKNAVERLSVLCPTGRVSLRAVERHVGDIHVGSAYDVGHVAEVVEAWPGDLGTKIRAIEHAAVQSALRAKNGNRSAAARALGVSRHCIDRNSGDELTSCETTRRLDLKDP